MRERHTERCWNGGKLRTYYTFIYKIKFKFMRIRALGLQHGYITDLQSLKFEYVMFQERTVLTCVML